MLPATAHRRMTGGRAPCAPSGRCSPAAGTERHRLVQRRFPGAAWRTPVEETTEVHVSIGRIEVTAVHEAPPPKRAPARGQRALSLEEYLARRKAGRS